MPVAAISLLANCGASKTINSQEELTNALKFVGVEYLQVENWLEIEKHEIHEFSPTTFHRKNLIEYSSDDYYHFEGEMLWKYSYDEEKKGFTKTIDDDTSDFIKIEQLYDDYGFSECVAAGLTYDNLKHNNDNTYTYNTELQNKEICMTLQFEAKKLTFFEITMENEGEKYTYMKDIFTYEQKEIQLPTPVE